MTRLCSHCSAPLTGRQQVKFCSRACAGKDNEDWSPPPLHPSVTYARNDMALVGAVRMVWAGAPMYLAELAEWLNEPNLEFRVRVLWFADVFQTPKGPVIAGRNESYGDVRRFIDGLCPVMDGAVCGLQTDTEAVEWRLEEEAA